MERDLIMEYHRPEAGYFTAVPIGGRTELSIESEQRGTRFPSSWRPDDTLEGRPPERPQPTNNASWNIGSRDSRENFFLGQSHHTGARPNRSDTEKSSTIQQLLRYQFVYSMAALPLHLASMAIGAWLAYGGAIGHTAITAQVLSEFGLKVQMTDAAPGTILFLVGLLSLCLTRFDVRVDK